MSKPIVGVICSSKTTESRFATQFTGEKNLRAVCDVAQAMPIMFAGLPNVTDIGTLLSVVDGVLLTGARANVHPTFFKVEPNEKHEPYDMDRDHVALELTRACVELGKPVFGLCRGIQEMNVAFGGTLHPEIRDLPGRMNHRAPRLKNGDMHPDPDVVFADRHEVNFVAGGFFSKLYGMDKIHVNSLHGQGIEEVGRRVVVEGVAEDGTIEAVRIEGASNFAIGVQWHAEYDPQTNPVNRVLFERFGEALKRN